MLEEELEECWLSSESRMFSTINFSIMFSSSIFSRDGVKCDFDKNPPPHISHENSHWLTPLIDIKTLPQKLQDDIWSSEVINFLSTAPAGRDSMVMCFYLIYCTETGKKVSSLLTSRSYLMSPISTIPKSESQILLLQLNFVAKIMEEHCRI